MKIKELTTQEINELVKEMSLLVKDIKEELEFRIKNEALDV